MRMTKEQVIKALECCTSEGKRQPENCEECPYNDRFKHGCLRKLLLDALRELKKTTD